MLIAGVLIELLAPKFMSQLSDFDDYPLSLPQNSGKHRGATRGTILSACQVPLHL